MKCSVGLKSGVPSAVVICTTTAIACLETGRHYIGYELDPEYFEIAEQRISDYMLDKL